jgi:hypothetical protein
LPSSSPFRIFSLLKPPGASWPIEEADSGDRKPLSGTSTGSEVSPEWVQQSIQLVRGRPDTGSNSGPPHFSELLVVPCRRRLALHNGLYAMSLCFIPAAEVPWRSRLLPKLPLIFLQELLPYVQVAFS